MKFSEDILKQFDLEADEEREPVNVMKVSEMLNFMKLCAERIVDKSKKYASCNDAEIQMDCMDIVTAKLNDFVQVFRDVTIFMRKEEGTYNGGTSLRYCISCFDTFGFEKTTQEESFLNELLLRNEITHDYFNREIHQQKLIWVMENCSDGAVDVYDDLRKYCEEQSLLDKFADKNA